MDAGQVALAEADLFDSLEHAEIKILGLLSLTAASVAGGHRYHYHRYGGDGNQRSQIVFHESFYCFSRPHEATGEIRVLFFSAAIGQCRTALNVDRQ